MSPQFRAIAAALWLAGMATAVAAQPGPSPAASAASPTSAASAASARAGSYRSAFEGYKTFNEQPVLPWRDSNNVVGRIGGWQAYAREGQGGAPAGSSDTPTGSSEKTAAPGMPAGHGGMKMAPDPTPPAAAGSAPAGAPMKAPMTMPAPKAKPSTAPASAAMPSGHTGHQKP